MKFSIQTEDKFESYFHGVTLGEAFALEEYSKLAILGGQNNTTLVNLNEPSNIVKLINIKTPLKWYVSNYEWDCSIQNKYGNERYLQTRNKIIEIVNCETSDTLSTLTGHSLIVNEAKWSPSKPSYVASTSTDNNLFIWNVDTSNKPIIKILSLGEVECLAWSKSKENVLAVSCNNDIRIYDIRKTNAAVRYVSNAHSKKVYSIDWSSTRDEEILISTSRDRNVKLWNFKMLNHKFMEKLIEDFPCWKAKFTRYGLCFAISPTCQSLNNFQMSKENNLNSNSVYNKYGYSNNNSNNNIVESIETENGTSTNLKAKNNNGNGNNSSNNSTKYDSLLICQITGFNEAKIYKFVTNQFDMIMNYDFYVQNDKFNIVSWTRDQHLCINSLDLNQIAPKEMDRSTSALACQKQKEEDDCNQNNKLVSLTQQNLNLLPHTNTTNSSRKSSFSECVYGTPPTNSLLNSRTFANNEREASFNLNEDFNIADRPGSISMTTHNILKTSSSAMNHDFLKRNPKCFGAKFSGLPEQLLLFSNEGVNSLKTKANSKENDNIANNLKKIRSSNNKQLSNSNKLQINNNKQFFKRVQARVYVVDISNIINVSREFADKYLIIGNNIGVICEQNKESAIQLKRYDIAKVWDMIKFITLKNVNRIPLNDQGRPWSSSTFGRSLLNSLIDNCIKTNDLQTASMIITKLKQHDMKQTPLPTQLLDKIFRLINETDNFRHIDKNSWQHYLKNDPSLLSYSILTSFNLNKLMNKFNDGEKEILAHYKNLCLLDPSRLNEFDNFLKSYSELLFKWEFYNKRIEILELLHEKPNDLDEKFECSKRCRKCLSIVTNSKCKDCNSYLIYCSICELPINGLTTFCIACGHGGHYDHLFEWFKKHDDCPCACGCRCVDYL